MIHKDSLDPRRRSTSIILTILAALSVALAGPVWGQSGSNAAVEAVNQGVKVLDAGRAREAISYFDQAIRLDPRIDKDPVQKALEKALKDGLPKSIVLASGDGP